MNDIAGYARVIAKARVQQEQSKPFLRKPFVKYGQCYVLAGYFLQLGAILGAKHRQNLDAFGHAFLGMRGAPGAVERFFAEAAAAQLPLTNDPSTTFTDYVRSEQIKRFDYSGDPKHFLLDHGLLKIDPRTATEMAWQFAEQGASLGAVHPEIARRIYDQTCRCPNKEDWDSARAAGLDIPVEPDRMSYEETERSENEEFMQYCEQCCPSLHSTLNH